MLKITIEIDDETLMSHFHEMPVDDYIQKLVSEGLIKHSWMDGAREHITKNVKFDAQQKGKITVRYLGKNYGFKNKSVARAFFKREMKETCVTAIRHEAMAMYDKFSK